ncbi:MAG: bifunctional diaminohydroxyphosphoribosylaminopyrimidine deaminase/5-amino-6-(5-phosphoribosylamino)uracil reductase RibD [Planctomycetota bacterium]
MTHENFMSEALSLAERGRGWVSPNPMVGALVVKDNHIIGRGWHQQFGGPHAEVFALREAGAAAAGATLYCTLEPCHHFGKTPPCIPTVIQAGIRTVVLGARDPNPVAGGGMEALQSSGVTVITGICEQECRCLNAPFFKFVRTGLPLISLKWAMTADGKLATAAGQSQWITSEAAREFAHGLRARHDAVLIGINTLLADSARLTCRVAINDKIRQPQRVILDSEARTPLDAPLWTAVGGGPIVIFCKTSAPAARRVALQSRGADVVTLDSPLPSSSGVPLREMLIALGRRGVLSVLVEGGSAILGSFVDARLADKAFIFVAPKILGGRASLSAVSGMGLGTLADCLELQALEIARLGPDVLLSGQIGDWNW